MNIQIDGVNTLNKGAELMLVAILEELENKFPGANVYINPDSVFDAKLLPKYNLQVKKRLGLKIGRFVNHLSFRLKIKQPILYFKEHYSPKKIDFILDASGFKYSDQWNRSKKWLDIKENYYSKAKANGTKIYFLTQAFGPFKTEGGKRSVQILSTYCDLIFAREEMSYDYLLEANANPDKVKVSCDFTFKVKGKISKKHEHLKNSIAIIPNKKMITHGGDNSNEYLDFFTNLIAYFQSKKENVFLLNHESEGDFKLCKKINSLLTKELEIVSGVTAKEVKGVIGISKLVISSRFHGVASSLSQGVPCLATSWNHKYEMLFKNFNQSNCIIKAGNHLDKTLSKVDDVYKNYDFIHNTLTENKYGLVKQIDKMWDTIFLNLKK